MTETPKCLYHLRIEFGYCSTFTSIYVNNPQLPSSAEPNDSHNTTSFREKLKEGFLLVPQTETSNCSAFIVEVLTKQGATTELNCCTMTNSGDANKLLLLPAGGNCRPLLNDIDLWNEEYRLRYNKLIGLYPKCWLLSLTCR